MIDKVGTRGRIEDPGIEVMEAYDKIAARYRDARTGFHERKSVDRFIAHLPPAGKVLDIGCGCGVPIGRYLVNKGYRVTGL